MVVLSGKELGSSVKANVAALCKRFSKRFGRRPSLAVVLVGEDPASQTYVSSKRKACDEVGIRHLDYTFDAGIPQKQLLECISNLNAVIENAQMVRTHRTNIDRFQSSYTSVVFYLYA